MIFEFNVDQCFKDSKMNVNRISKKEPTLAPYVLLWMTTTDDVVFASPILASLLQVTKKVPLGVTQDGPFPAISDGIE